MWIQLLTGLLITAHGLLGCCWHHQHALARNERGDSACQDVHFHDHCIAGQFAPDNYADDTRQPTDDGCQESDCVYLAPRSANVPDQCAALPPNPLGDASPACRLATRGQNLGAEPPCLDDGGSSPRPHLLKQVFLL